MKSSDEILEKWAEIFQIESQKTDSSEEQGITLASKTYNLTLYLDQTQPLESAHTISLETLRPSSWNSISQQSSDDFRIPTEEHPTEKSITVSSSQLTIHPFEPETSKHIAQKYQILHQIGKGGMGTIYQAVQGDLQRHIALKTPNTKKLHRRFIEEAVVTAYVNHSNIIPVHDLISDHNGVSMIMQLIEGKPWDKHIQNMHQEYTQQIPDEIFDIEFERFIKTCEAVEFSHSKGVLHNDIKSENIMVGSYGDLLLMDWGCATTTPHLTTPTISILNSNTIHSPFGTPIYMSPEQACGDGKNIGPWSDIYLLGGLLYELLEGQPPRKKEAIEIVVQKAIDGICEPFSKTHDPYLQTIAEKCLQSKIEDRYQSMKELLEDLREFYKTRDAFQLLQRAKHDFDICKESIQNKVHSTRSLLLELVENINSFEQVYQLKPLEEAITGKYKSIELLCELAIQLGDVYLAEAYVTSLPSDKTYQILRKQIEEKKNDIQRASVRDKQNKLRLQFLLIAIVSLIIVGYSEIYEQKNLAQTNALRAEKIAQATLKNLDDIQTLSESHHSKKLIQETDLLWPTLPKMIPSIDEWIKQVDIIHQSVVSNHESLQKEEQELQQRKIQLLPELWNSDKIITILEWRIELRRQLLQDIDTLETDWKPKLQKRKELAQEIVEKTIGQKEIWEFAIQDIQNADHYNGLTISPQLGLIPLEVNQQGYWEFAHLISGEAPTQKDQLGNWIIHENTAIVLVLLPEATFWMGSDKTIDTKGNFDPNTRDIESPSHQVHVDAFFMSKYELNQAQWLRVMNSNSSAYLPRQIHGNQEITLLHPVEHMTYEQAYTVSQRFDLQIPTEAQWEYANRSGTQSVYWSGNTIRTLQGKANISDAGGQKLGAPSSWKFEEELFDNHIVHAPIGSFAPNKFGLHDTVGNVWEWCRDHFGSYTFPTDHKDGLRKIPTEERVYVFRGGGFRSTSIHARSADRYSIYASDYNAYDLGIRLSRAIE